MKTPESDRLLKEILAGEELADFRQASLEHGLASLRRQRQRQRAAQVCVLAVLALGCGAAIVFSRSRDLGTRQLAWSNATPAMSASLRVRTPEVRYISDDELLALFPDRVVALIGKPGQQRLVFLDEPAPEAGDGLEPKVP